MKKTDVVIIGAGLNGLIAALALGGRQALRPLKITIIDKFDPQRFATPQHDSRASALTLATQTMFDVLGLWDSIKPHRQVMAQIIVTDGGSPTDRPSLLTFAIDSQQNAPAAMVENHHLFTAALVEIATCANIEMLTGQGFDQITYGPGLALVTLLDGTQVKANLVIGADGRNSSTREKAGLKMQGWDYPQSAITLTVGHDISHGGTAEEHFTSGGVFAILPLVGNRSSIVWSASHAEAQRLHLLSDAEFLGELSLCFGNHLGQLTLSGARHVYPLSMKLSEKMTAPRLALLGDAAHVIHPLAGLGLNLGFKDAAALADCVSDALAQGADIGGASVLDHYEKWRRFDTVSTAFLLDGLNRLFANDVAALKFLRSSGLKLIDQSAPFKSYFMKEAAGQTGPLPRLMRGLVA